MDIETLTVVISTIVGYTFGIIQKKYRKNTSELIPIKNAITGLVIGFIVYFTGKNSDLVQSLMLGLSGTLASTGLYEAHKSMKPLNENTTTEYKEEIEEVEEDTNADNIN